MYGRGGGRNERTGIGMGWVRDGKDIFPVVETALAWAGSVCGERMKVMGEVSLITLPFSLMK